jgi:hypothetical protein
LHPYL